MSSVQGFPDWQRITQWLGQPLVQGTGVVIGVGTHVDGPLQVSNFASVIVALKATGGNVTVTVKQTVPAGPASLVLTSSVVVAAGATLFEAFVLYGGAVELDLTGSVAGTSVDYALYGSNTTTNAQVITAATINVQHNEVLVAAEPTLDFVDAAGFVWSVVDDGPNTRVKLTPPSPAIAQLGDVTVGGGGAASIDFQNIPQTFNHLKLLCFLRSDVVATSTDCLARLNADSAADYEYDYVRAVEGAAGGGVSRAQTSAYVATVAGASSGSNRFGMVEITLPNYTDAAQRGSVLGVGGLMASAISSSGVVVGHWDSLAAITRVTLTPGGGSWIGGSRATLYGLL